MCRRVESITSPAIKYSIIVDARNPWEKGSLPLSSRYCARKQKGVLKILLAFPYPRSTGHEKECNTDWDRILEVNSEDRENTVYIG